MDATGTVEAIRPSDFNGIILSAIIANAVKLARDPDWDEWRAYEVAKAAITEFNPTKDEYQRAIGLLAEALKV